MRPEREEMRPRGGEVMVVRGISWPAVFTGWVVAFFAGLILSALVGAVFTGFGTTATALALARLGVAGGVAGLILWFLAYFLGGWVAGKVAGMNGLLQGLMVWVVGVLFLILIYILAAIIGSGIALIGGITLPTVGNLAAIISIAGVALLAAELLGALIGGWLATRKGA